MFLLSPSLVIHRHAGLSETGYVSEDTVDIVFSVVLLGNLKILLSYINVSVITSMIELYGKPFYSGRHSKGKRPNLQSVAVGLGYVWSQWVTVARPKINVSWYWVISLCRRSVDASVV